MWGFTSDLIYVFILFVKNIIFYCNILALSLILMTMYDVVNDFIYTYIYYKLEENMVKPLQANGRTISILETGKAKWPKP
jgi:hypothetical protein